MNDSDHKNHVTAARSATFPANPATISPMSIHKDEATDTYEFIGDGGVRFPLGLKIQTVVNTDGILLRKIAPATNFVVDDAGLVARIRAKTLGFDLATGGSGAVTISAGDDVTLVAAAKGTVIAPQIGAVGGDPIVFKVAADPADGEIDVSVTFNGAGNKKIIIEYGPDQIVLTAFAIA